MPSFHVRGVTELANAHPKQTADSTMDERATRKVTK